MGKIQTAILIDAAILTGVGEVVEPHEAQRSFQVTGATSAGAGTCDVLVEGSNDGVAYVSLAIISLVLSTTPATDGFVSNAPWKFIRADMTTVTGTDATVTCTMGTENN